MDECEDMDGWMDASSPLQGGQYGPGYIRTQVLIRSPLPPHMNVPPHKHPHHFRRVSKAPIRAEEAGAVSL